jgi:hypothetical protein
MREAILRRARSHSRAMIIFGALVSVAAVALALTRALAAGWNLERVCLVLLFGPQVIYWFALLVAKYRWSDETPVRR